MVEVVSERACQHLVKKFAEQGRRTMVIGHRGGFFGPENSMKTFKAAIANNLEGIEFDVSDLAVQDFLAPYQVWLSKDNVPMVLHGGSDGQLGLYGLPEERVFNWTRADLQSKIDLGEGERIPTLESLIELCQGTPHMLLNIELKGPLDPAWEAKYDYDDAARRVVSLIQSYQIGLKTMVSSFVPKIIQSVLKVAPPVAECDFIIQSLCNRGNKPCPRGYATLDQTTGINISYTYLTSDLMVRKAGDASLMGVYFSTSHNSEDSEMWSTVFTLQGGVDFFYSDMPLVAMQMRNTLQPAAKL